MSDFLVDAHSLWQFVTLAGVIVALIFAFRGSELTVSHRRAYMLAAITVDIQVTLGILVWITNSGWSLGFAQGWLHPVVGLAALGVLHVFIGRARESEPEGANRIARLGLIIVILLVVVAIGIGEMA